jgi:hypothetical protein
MKALKAAHPPAHEESRSSMMVGPDARLLAFERQVRQCQEGSVLGNEPRTSGRRNALKGAIPGAAPGGNVREGAKGIKASRGLEP